MVLTVCRWLEEQPVPWGPTDRHFLAAVVAFHLGPPRPDRQGNQGNQLIINNNL